LAATRAASAKDASMWMETVDMVCLSGFTTIVDLVGEGYKTKPITHGQLPGIFVLCRARGASAIT
jgi:hypothetical protein